MPCFTLPGTAEHPLITSVAPAAEARTSSLMQWVRIGPQIVNSIVFAPVAVLRPVMQ
jgi:hypothetical protein